SPFLLLGVSCAHPSVLGYFSKLLNHPIAPSNYNWVRFLVFPSFAQRAFAAPPPSPLPGKSPLLLASGGCCVGFYGGAAAPLTSAAACCRYRLCTIAGGPHGSDVFFCGAVAT
ncbi:unnamed protein product, partial [Ixodes pacificus]